MPLDPSYQFDNATEAQRALHFPNQDTGDYNTLLVDENPCNFRPVLSIKPKCCRTFYVEFEITSIQGSPVWAKFCPMIGPTGYLTEGDTPGTSHGSLFEGPHEGFYGGLTGPSTASSVYKDAEGSISASATSYAMNITAIDPSNVDGTNIAWDFLTVGDYFGMLIDFNSPSGNLTCELSTFVNGNHSYTAQMPISNPDEPWTWLMALGTNAVSTDVGIRWNEEKADWLGSPPKDPIPWKLPLETSTYVENGYCRMRNRHGSQQEMRLNCQLLDNALTVVQKAPSHTGNQNIQAFATTPRYSGKAYYEITCNFTESDFTNPVWWFGAHGSGNAVNTSSVTLPQPQHFAGLGSNIGSALYRNRFGMSDKLTNGQAGALRPVVDGDVFMFAIHFLNQDAAADGDSDLANVWYGKNGTWLSGDPSTPTGHSDAIANQAYPAPRPFVSSSTQSGTGGIRSWTFNFGATAFAYTLPTGFTAWDDTAVPTGGF